MTTDISSLLRNIASDFNSLAEALEQEQRNTESRLCCIEHRTEENRQVLKDAASVILSRLEG